MLSHICSSLLEIKSFSSVFVAGSEKEGVCEFRPDV